MQLDIANLQEMYYNKTYIETHERESNMVFDLKYFILVAAAMICALALLALILYIFARKAFYGILAFFVVDNGKAGEHEKLLEPVPHPKRYRRKSVNEPLVEVCTLIRKSDDRLRIIEKDGTVKITDAYYELIFVNRKNEELRVACSPDAYRKVPFDSEGSLTYRRNTLVRFKYYKDRKEVIVSNEPEEGTIENEGKLVIFKQTIE